MNIVTVRGQLIGRGLRHFRALCDDSWVLIGPLGLRG